MKVKVMGTKPGNLLKSFQPCKISKNREEIHELGPIAVPYQKKKGLNLVHYDFH